MISFSVPDAPSDAKSLSAPEMIPLVEQTPEIESSNTMDKCQKVKLIKEYCQPLPVPEGFPHLFLSAQVAEKAFKSSYRLQMASENAQWATGYALAEFEKILCFATPVIASSLLTGRCGGCFNNHLYIPSIYREQTQKVSLRSIWDWYEEPGNYGMKVNLDDPRNQKGCVADTVPFHAYFVPLLSAIQLFGYHHSSSSCGDIQKSSPEVDDKDANVNFHFGNPASHSCLEASMTGDILAEMMNTPSTNHLSNVYTNDRTKPLALAAPSLFSSAELIFEFFESEQPQRRMPLHKKIMELTSGKLSNTQTFGDPSKLECTNLDDLHPASWFSVAWYPIYRIPEGKLHAAFLTYHSLGHYFQRSKTTNYFEKSALCLILPVIGLESYNIESDFWFSPNIEAESILGELTSSVLKERLRILEANAQLFARGMVSRDDKMVANRQPDYEFFMSRKK